MTRSAVRGGSAAVRRRQAGGSICALGAARGSRVNGHSPGDPATPDTLSPVRRPIRRSVGALVLLAIVAAGCAGGPSATFDPSGPCAVDGRVAGAYPDLEAKVPRTLGGRAPQTVEFGPQLLSREDLGTLVGHGIREVRFAGGLWPVGDRGGITLAVFTAPGLTAEWLGEWYEASARAGRSTGSIKPSKTEVGGRPANRLDLVNADSNQTVVTWPAATPDSVNVVVAADVPEDQIQAAFAAFP